MSELIEIKPKILVHFECLFCGFEEVQVSEALFQGTHILADCHCENCGKDFYHTLPVGHDKLFPISFSRDGETSKYDKTAAKWLAGPLFNSFFNNPKEEAAIERKEFFRRESAIILNCLDSCFGHVLSRLWNAKLLIDSYPDRAVIVVLPKSLEWIVPIGVAEVWAVVLPLQKLDLFIANFDSFVKKELTRFKEVYLSPAYIQIDPQLVGVRTFFKVKEFDLSTFSAKPPQISFILRNDRFWHGNSFEFFLFQACVKLKLLNTFRKYFIWKQNRLVNSVVKKTRKQLNDVNFSAVGIGKAEGLSPLVKDLRSETVSESIEREWCGLYAKSHIVIGVHGSNMLIPTSLAAGFIELLPRYKIPHITEDLALQQPSRYSLFLGRHLDHYSTAELVSLHAVSMIKDFSFLYKNTEQNHKIIFGD